MISNLLTNIAVFIVSVSLTLLAASLYFYFYQYEAIVTDYMEKTRNVIQVVCGKQIDDERIYTLEPGRCAFWNGEFNTTVTVNPEGYRAVRQTPQAIGREVVVAGDSHAMGWGVSDGEDLAALIGATGRYRVTNLAMSSYGTARELFALQREAAHADVVVLQYCDNDYDENTAFLSSPDQFRSNYKDRSNNFKVWMDKVEAYNEEHAGRRKVYNIFYGNLARLWALLRLPPKTYAQTNSKDLPNEAQAFAEVLQEFASYLSDKQVIVFESNGSRTLRPDFARVFSQAVRNAGLTNIHVLDAYAFLDRTHYYYIDDHLTPKGHWRIADAVIPRLDEISASQQH